MEFLCCASTAELDPIERAKQAKVKADAANNKRINLGKCINNFYSSPPFNTLSRFHPFNI